MKPYQRDFIELARSHNVLRFGSFTLKSGRQSPYFFNAGAFSSGAALAALGRAYAQRIADSAVAFDMLLGPAYKGIPLASATAVALADVHDRDLPFAYNRKEAKDHGEGGVIVGAPLSGRVLVIDDVITAGTAVGEVVQLIHAAGAQLAGVVIGLDRQERGRGDRSAIAEIEDRWQAPVLSIITLNDIVDYLGEAADAPESALPAVAAYRERYGC